MKTSQLSLFILSLSIVFVSARSKELSTNQKSQVKHLFIIVVNGLRYDDVIGNKNHLYSECVWNKLRPLGTICSRFYNRELTYPIPAQASLLTGVWQTFENPLSETIRPAYPTLFEYWKKKEPRGTCYFASSKKKLGILGHSDYKEYGKPYAPVFDTNVTSGTDTNSREGGTGVIENAIYEKAVSHVFKLHPSFVYLNLGSGGGGEAYQECQSKDKKDDCGSADQLNAYYESIILTDTIVYDFWNRIQRDTTYKDNSIFIFLSDHGRHTDDFHGYGDNCRGCQQLNFLIIGPGIKKNFVSKKKRTLIDICRTVGMLCDFPTPFSKGNIMKEVFY